MNNYYLPCFNRIDFVVIPSYIEFPCFKHCLFQKIKIEIFAAKWFPVNRSKLQVSSTTEIKKVQRILKRITFIYSKQGIISIVAEKWHQTVVFCTMSNIYNETFTSSGIRLCCLGFMGKNWTLFKQNLFRWTYVGILYFAKKFCLSRNFSP